MTSTINREDVLDIAAVLLEILEIDPIKLEKYCIVFDKLNSYARVL